jgi:hypothetical protein
VFVPSAVLRRPAADRRQHHPAMQQDRKATGRVGGRRNSLSAMIL